MERWPSAAAHMVSLDIAEELGGSWGFRPSLRALPACWPQVFVPCGAPTNPPVDPHESLNFQLLWKEPAIRLHGAASPQGSSWLEPSGTHLPGMALEVQRCAPGLDGWRGAGGWRVGAMSSWNL